MKKIYVSDDKKPIQGDLSGIKKIERTSSGMVLNFRTEDEAYRAAQILMNSGYETVKILY